MSSEAPLDERVCAAEVIGALCLASDLGMGLPFEHGLQSTLSAMRLAERLGVDHDTASQTYYASLLAHSGCTTDAWVAAEVFGGALTTHLVPVIFGSPREQFAGILGALPSPGAAPPVRAMQTVRRLPKAARLHKPQLAALCDVAQTLSEQLGLPRAVQELFSDLTGRWDGKGVLGRAEREDVPLALRITHVAQDVSVQRLLGGEETAVRVVSRRAGHAFDPTVAGCLVDDAAAILAVAPERSAWEETLACEQHPRLELEGRSIDRALTAMGAFSDLISPYLSGHCAGVAELATAAARRCRVESREVVALGRAGLVHDIGRVAVGAGIWQKRGPLTPARTLGISVKTADRHIQNAYARRASRPARRRRSSRWSTAGWRHGENSRLAPRPCARSVPAIRASERSKPPRGGDEQQRRASWPARRSRPTAAPATRSRSRSRRRGSAGEDMSRRWWRRCARG